MLFWIESNESGWTTDAFLETFDARARMELQGNVIIACGEGTDAYGNVVPMAWYCVVDPGFIANVEVHCTNSDEADSGMRNSRMTHSGLKTPGESMGKVKARKQRLYGRKELQKRRKIYETK